MQYDLVQKMACCCFVLESSICASVSFASLNLILQSSGGLVNVNSGANSVKYCDARTKVALIMSNLCRSRTIRRHSAKYDKPRTKEHIGKRHSGTVLHYLFAIFNISRQWLQASSKEASKKLLCWRHMQHQNPRLILGENFLLNVEPKNIEHI